MRNFFERFTSSIGGEKKGDGALEQEVKETIRLRADIRRREQQLNTDALNATPLGLTNAMKTAYDTTLARMRREASGAGDPVKEDAVFLCARAGVNKDLFPLLAGYDAARAARARVDAGEDPQRELAMARAYAGKEKGAPKISPSNLLPDAIILGVEKSVAGKRELPLPETIARGVANDPRLLADYALVLDEKDRPGFMATIPEKHQREVSAILDASVARVLHQALIAKGEGGEKSSEETQRAEVRRRLFAELKTTAEKKDSDDRHMAGILTEAMVTLGEDTRQLLLEIIRDEAEGGDAPSRERRGHFPRIIKVFLDEFDDWKGNDVILRLAGDQRLNHHLSLYLFGKLIDKGYLSKDVGEWWTASKKSKKKNIEADEARRLDVLQRVITDLGVVPNKDILTFIHNDRGWRTNSIAERIAEIRGRQKEFEKFTDQRSLVEHLHNNDHAAMIYYLLHGGEDRFNLINNYSFGNFKEMLGLIADLRVHEAPLKQFERALAKSGKKTAEIQAIRERVLAGHYPVPNVERAYHEVSFEVSENAAIKNANTEIGRVLGKNELGVVLLFPMYREYCTALPEKERVSWQQKMDTAMTLADRRVVITALEEAYPDWREKAKAALEENWKILGEKMLLEATLENVFGEERVPIRGEELLPRLDAKRLDLKRMKKELLVALKGGNERAKKVSADIGKKKWVLGGLREGLAHATEGTRGRLQKQIDDIERDLKALEEERQLVANMKVEERFAGLSDAERKERVDELAKEIIALTEKSPSAIFTYITMQVLGEERLREQDIALIQELESHLQGPFQTIQDTLTYQKPSPRGEVKKRQRVGLRWVDKTRDLMHMVRFADSKICCFSSNNYEMVVQHDMKNKFWVASINADPLSFVVAIEQPREDSHKDERQMPRENLGFIFGNFSIDEDSKLGIVLNGIYYAPGIESAEQADTILAGVERLFDGLPLATVAAASQHGGAVARPGGYATETITLTRLRALDDSSGRPETKIYDDLGTGSGLNRPHVYENLYVKHLKT